MNCEKNFVSFFFRFIRKIEGQSVQTSYSNCQSRANDTDKTFCDNQFNQLENNCNNGTEHIERSRGNFPFFFFRHWQVDKN